MSTNYPLKLTFISISAVDLQSFPNEPNIKILVTEFGSVEKITMAISSIVTTLWNKTFYTYCNSKGVNQLEYFVYSTHIEYIDMNK